MVNIYKLYDDKGNIYIGSTSRSLSARLAEHKYQRRLDIDFNNIKIELIEECEDSLRYERETFYIKLLSNKNKCLAGIGPIGYKNSEKEIKRKSDLMTSFYKYRKDIIEKARKKSLTSEKQKERSKKAKIKRTLSMPKYYAINKKTNKIFGPYKGYEISKKELCLHPSTIANCVNKNQKNRTYIFKVGDIL